MPPTHSPLRLEAAILSRMRSEVTLLKRSQRALKGSVSHTIRALKGSVSHTIKLGLAGKRVPNNEKK